MNRKFSSSVCRYNDMNFDHLKLLHEVLHIKKQCSKIIATSSIERNNAPIPILRPIFFLPRLQSYTKTATCTVRSLFISWPLDTAAGKLPPTNLRELNNNNNNSIDVLNDRNVFAQKPPYTSHKILAKSVPACAKPHHRVCNCLVNSKSYCGSGFSGSPKVKSCDCGLGSRSNNGSGLFKEALHKTGAKVSSVAVTLKQWWRDVGLCPRTPREPISGISNCSSGGGGVGSVGGVGNEGGTCIKRGGRSRRHRPMGHSLSMCKLHQCRHKKSLHLRNSEESRMPGEGAGPESGLHRLHRNCYDPEYARMEAWLDEHPDFVQDYFLRKATRQVVDAWLVSHATPTSSSAELASPTHTSRGGSGATTPVRKISAHEFERGGLLKPMISTVDGQTTFLTGTESQTSSGPGGHSPTPGRRQRRSRHELRQLDEKELIFELVKDICNELEVRSLCHKILQNVSMLLHADRGSLFLVQGNKSSPSHGPNKRTLVSKLFDVCSKSTLMEMEKKDEIRIPWGTGIVGYVADSGEPVNIPDAYKDERFNHDIDVLTGYKTHTLLCMPIKDTNGDVIGVAQVINKLGEAPFSEQDEKIFSSYLQFCGIGLRNAHLYEKSQLEVKRNQVLLDLARMIFEEQSTIEHVVFRILTHTQSLIQCQRVQVLLMHQASKGSISRVFDFEATDLNGEDGESRTSPHESRFPINIGITGYVATTGETVSIPSAYDDPRFDPNVDEGTNFKHKTILCMAIKNSSGQIIGVIQLVNKFEDLPFTQNDENFVEAFAIFCGMGIHNTHMYERAVVAIAKQSVTLEVLSYHATASIDDAQRLRKMRVPSAAHIHLHEFAFDDISMDDDETIAACVRMFMDLDLVERFHMDSEVLCRWLLSVKKNYRNVTYHNWRHAFNVAQMMFAILTATQWWKIFGEVECLALIIGCLCHDLDHRGTNNSFQIKASSPLAQLYSTSTMEHHHFDQCVMILNSPGNQLLANVSPDEYSRVIRLVEEAILSTDLAVYFRKRGAFFSTITEGPNFDTSEKRELLRAMLMTVCDLAAITKPWDVEKRVAELVSSEFFEQGDMEREEFNITPIDLMNREKEDQLPLMQVDFIDTICLPIYEAFARLSDKLQPLVEGVNMNRAKWIEIAAQQCLIPAENMEKDSNDNMAISKPNTPEVPGSPVHNNVSD